MESWLENQSKHFVLSWEKAHERFHPEYLDYWVDPKKNLQLISEEGNNLAAAMHLKWNSYLTKPNLRILDLGAGTGWLSIELSKHVQVREIYALDSSPYNLRTMLPALALLMGGEETLKKIKPILGFFTPILTEDNFFDIVVACSSVHHSTDLGELFGEAYRVIKPGGLFIIANEVPIPTNYFAMTAIYRCAKILWTMLRKKWKPNSKPISESMFISNPFLGDRSYCIWQYTAAIEAAGFSVQIVETTHHPYKNKTMAKRTNSNRRFTHFIAHKSDVMTNA